MKHNADGTVNQYKVQLVMKGFVQAHGVDYEETFARVDKMTTIRMRLHSQHPRGGTSTKWMLRTSFFKAN